MHWKITAGQIAIVTIGMVITWLLGLSHGAWIERINQAEDAEKASAND